MHDDAYIGGRSDSANNIKYVVHDDLGWNNQTTRYILLHHWLYKWFSQFRSCGTYSVLSWSSSFVCFAFRWSFLCAIKHINFHLFTKWETDLHRRWWTKSYLYNLGENYAFSALTLLFWRQEGNPACKLTECQYADNANLTGTRWRWFVHVSPFRLSSVRFLSSLTAIKPRMVKTF